MGSFSSPFTSAAMLLLIAATPPPVEVPSGARLIKGDALRQLIVGATMIGPAVTDNAPVASRFFPNGSYAGTAIGVIPVRFYGTFDFRHDQLCMKGKSRGVRTCAYIARAQDGGYLISSGTGSHLYWNRVRIVPAEKR